MLLATNGNQPHAGSETHDGLGDTGGLVTDVDDEIEGNHRLPLRMMTNARLARLRTAIFGFGLVALNVAAATVVEVEITGLEAAQLENVEKLTAIVIAVNDDVLPQAHLLQLHQQAPNDIASALEPFGFYNVSVQSSWACDALDQCTARYDVALGEPVRWGAVDIKIEGEAGGDPAVCEVLSRVPIASSIPLATPGQSCHRLQAAGGALDAPVFVHREYESSKRYLLNRLLEFGYFDAVLSNAQVRIDPAQARADVALTLDAGARHRIAGMTIRGAQFPQPFLQRYHVLPVGQPYDRGQLSQLQDALIASNYFDSVIVAPITADTDQPEAAQLADDEVLIIVDVTPAKRTVYEVGVGYGTDSGPGVAGHIDRRWVNRHGHSMRFEVALNTRRSFTDFAYRLPGRDLNRGDYVLSAGFIDEQTDSSDRRIARVGGLRDRRRGQWRLSESIELRRESFEIGRFNDRVNYLLPSFVATRRLGDDPLFVTDGSLLTLAVRSVPDSLLSDFQLLQADVEARWIRMLDARNRVIIRGKLGTTVANGFDRSPPSLRYFAGGDRSIRGFDYEALGPEDSGGDVVGGKHLAVGSVTLEHYFRSAWGAAAFVDAGNAFDDAFDAIEVGVGLGLRWRSPVGLIRADLGVPLTADGVRLHFVMGPDL